MEVANGKTLTFFLAASTISVASRSFIAKHFSTKTCLPALIICRAVSWWPASSASHQSAQLTA